MVGIRLPEEPVSQNELRQIENCDTRQYGNERENEPKRSLQRIGCRTLM
jgi:hypothetical protein